MKVKYTTILIIEKAGQRGESNMDSFKKKKKQHLNHCIYSYLFPQKSQGFLPLFKRKEKSSIPSHLKGMCTIKRVLTPMRYVETVIYKHIFHLFSFSMPEGKKKKNLHIKPLPSEVFREEKKKALFFREGRWGGRD